MNSIGFLKSKKTGEERIAVFPCDLIDKNVNTRFLFFEEGYGEKINISDDEFKKIGCNIASREEVLKCDIVCDVKLGDADYLDLLDNNKILFGWAHAVQNVDFTTKCIDNKHTVIAWEELYDNGGGYLFVRNREIAGEAAIIQAVRYSKKMPYDSKIAILGNGNTARGAKRILEGLGGAPVIYKRKDEDLFKKEMFDYDILVNCIMWDTSRNDRIIYKEDLKKMKKGTLIIDVSCDKNLEIETSRPTSIENPIYVIDGVVHYCVDNTPAMFPITVSKSISKAISPLLNELIEKNCDYSKTINNAIVIKNGSIIDERIKIFRQRIK